MSTFGAVIIGDEILSGKRQDKHFAKIAELLAARGLRLSWVAYLGDDRERRREVSLGFRVGLQVRLGIVRALHIGREWTRHLARIFADIHQPVRELVLIGR